MKKPMMPKPKEMPKPKGLPEPAPMFDKFGNPIPNAASKAADKAVVEARKPKASVKQTQDRPDAAAARKAGFKR